MSTSYIVCIEEIKIVIIIIISIVCPATDTSVVIPILRVIRADVLTRDCKTVVPSAE